RLGVGSGITEGDDKHLREIKPLIDARQFELITQPDSGLVVIQGGAGSGKTTIGLHRLAYLAFHDPKRFRPDKMLVVVFNEALVRYIGQVLPSLGLTGVSIRTYRDWAARLRASALPQLPRTYSDETPGIVTRMKKHPAMLKIIDAHVAALAGRSADRLREQLAVDPNLEPGLLTFERSSERPLVHRYHGLRSWIDDHQEAILPAARHAAERIIGEGLELASDVAEVWADLLTDREALRRGFETHAPGAFQRQELERALAWCIKQCGRALAQATEQEERDDAAPTVPAPDKWREAGEFGDEPEPEGDDFRAIDGLELEERATLDREDDTLLLRLLQRLRGPLRKGQTTKEALGYEHVLLDEAQDLSPVEMAVVFGT